MSPDASEFLTWAPAFVLVFARVAPASAMLPGLGETGSPATVKIGFAFAITVLMLPAVQPLVPPVPSESLEMAIMVAGEVVTGLSFGWLARIVALALPVAAQFIGYLVGLSSVLQPDADMGSQSGALAKLFSLAIPLVLLTTNLYTLPLTALMGLFRLIPPGHLLPIGDNISLAIQAVAVEFSLALQLASPFVVAGVAWHMAMGLITRVVSRMQIYFVSVPGQIMFGLALLAVTSGAITLAWREQVAEFLESLPGAAY